MKSFLLALAFIPAFLTPKGCQTAPKPPPPAEVASAPVLGAANQERESKAAAAVAGAQQANEANAPGPAKEAVKGELKVAAANLRQPTQKDLDEAVNRVKLAMSGDLQAAYQAWANAATQGLNLQKRVGELEQQVKTERAEAARELGRQLEEARNEERRKAEAKTNMLLQLGTFGLGALLMIAAVVTMQLAATVPILGPKISQALGIAGAILLGIGVLLRSVDRFVDAHPHLFFGGLVTVVLALIGAAVFAWSNHHHHAEKTS